MSNPQYAQLMGTSDALDATAAALIGEAVAAANATRALDVRDFGAVGDGVTDDSAAIEAALAAWLAADMSDLLFPPGHMFLVSSTPTLTFTELNGPVSGRIQGYGATILADTGVDYGLCLEATGTASSSGIVVAGLRFEGCGFQMTVESTAWLWDITLADLTPHNFDEHGIDLQGVFECSIRDPRVRAAASNTTGYGISIVDTGDQQASSIDIYGGSVRGGYYGLYSDGVEVKITGGTYLFAQREGILIADDAHGTHIDGVHVEKCWESAASQSVGGAGIKVSGAATVTGVYATASGGKMKYAVEVYADGKANIIGGRSDGLVSYAKVGGNGSSAVTLIGVQNYDDTGYTGKIEVINSGTVPTPTVTLTPGGGSTSGGSPSLSTVASSGLTPAWLLDAAGTESVSFTARIPNGWKTFDIVVRGANSGGGSGDVALRAIYLSATTGGSTTSGHTAGSKTVATAGSSGVVQDVTLISGVAAPTVGKTLTVRIDRMGAETEDTLANDWALIEVVLVRVT